MLTPEQRRLAVALLLTRLRRTPDLFYPVRRDTLGLMVAHVITIARYLWVIVTRRPIPPMTKVERRALVNARSRLVSAAPTADFGPDD